MKAYIKPTAEGLQLLPSQPLAESFKMNKTMTESQWSRGQEGGGENKKSIWNE